MEATALKVETIDQNTPLPTGQDPMEIRWYINPIVRDKLIDNIQAGFSWLEFGKFSQAKYFDIPEELHTIDDNPNLPREHMVRKSAESVQMYLESVAGGKTFNGHPDPQKTNWGIQFAFYGEKDVAKMAVLDSVLLPNLSDARRHAAALGLTSPIGAKCPSEDPLEDRETCPTCWLKWVESDACQARMAEIAAQGVPVEVYDRGTNETTTRVVAPSMAELESGRQVVLAALQTGLKAARETWNTVAVEVREKSRKAPDRYQDNIRKDVHADRPAEDQLNQIRELARVQNTGSGDNSAVMERVVGVLDRIDQRLSKLEGNPEPQAQTGVDFGPYGQCQVIKADDTQCRNRAEANGACKNPAHQAKIAESEETVN
jgi:hypothetical protein